MTFQYTDISLHEFPGEVSLVLYSPKCNFACPYCFNPEIREKEPISFKQAKDAIDEHRDFITAVTITGGEPNMNPQINKILKYIKDCGLKIKVNTNGFMPLYNRGIRTLRFVDYLNISLKDPNICTCVRPSTFNWVLGAHILEYSFVYSKTFMPKPVLKRFANQLNDKIYDDWHTVFSGTRWTKPDIFTITQLRTGNCLDKDYNNCSIPTRKELIDVAMLFKDIPRKKLVIETHEYGRETLNNIC